MGIVKSNKSTEEGKKATTDTFYMEKYINWICLYWLDTDKGVQIENAMKMQPKYTLSIQYYEVRTAVKVKNKIPICKNSTLFDEMHNLSPIFKQKKC